MGIVHVLSFLAAAVLYTRDAESSERQPPANVKEMFRFAMETLGLQYDASQVARAKERQRVAMETLGFQGDPASERTNTQVKMRGSGSLIVPKIRDPNPRIALRIGQLKNQIETIQDRQRDDQTSSLKPDPMLGDGQAPSERAPARGRAAMFLLTPS